MFDPDLLVGFLSYGPIYSAEKYTGNKDVYRLAWFEKVCFDLMVWCAQKIICTNLLFVYKEDLYNDKYVDQWVGQPLQDYTREHMWYMVGLVLSKLLGLGLW